MAVRGGTRAARGLSQKGYSAVMFGSVRALGEWYGHRHAFDPVTEQERARAGPAAAIPNLVGSLRAVPVPDAGSGVPAWSVGDVGAHLAAVHLAYASLVSPDEAVDREGVLPSGGGPSSHASRP